MTTDAYRRALREQSRLLVLGACLLAFALVLAAVFAPARDGILPRERASAPAASPRTARADADAHVDVVARPVRFAGTSHVARGLLGALDVDLRLADGAGPAPTLSGAVRLGRGPSATTCVLAGVRALPDGEGSVRAAGTCGALGWHFSHASGTHEATMSVKAGGVGYRVPLYGEGVGRTSASVAWSVAADAAAVFLPRFVELLVLYVVLAAGLAMVVSRRRARRAQGRGGATGPGAGHEASASMAGQVKFEMSLSLLAVTSAAMLSFGITVAVNLGASKMYREVAEFGVPYWVLSVLALFVFADFYEYWTHRLVHGRWLFRHVHKLHHYSRQPTPWTTFSINLQETAIAAVVLPVAVCILPLHDSAILVYSVLSIFKNVLNHAGVDDISFGRHLDRWLVTPRFHELHHRHVNCNYGAYFTVWDRWMNTARFS